MIMARNVNTIVGKAQQIIKLSLGAPHKPQKAKPAQIVAVAREMIENAKVAVVASSIFEKKKKKHNNDTRTTQNTTTGKT